MDASVVDGDDSDSTRLLVDPSSAPSNSGKFKNKNEKGSYFVSFVLSYVICQLEGVVLSFFLFCFVIIISSTIIILYSCLLSHHERRVYVCLSEECECERGEQV